MIDIQGLAREVRIYIILLVEGMDDLNFCYHLFKHHKIAILGKNQVPSQGTIEVVSKQGIGPLLESVPTELARRDLKSLGILVDADANLDSRWQSIRTILLQYGYTNVPLNPDPHGTIIKEAGKPNVGVWLMPNNQQPGILEDFCGYLVPNGDQLWTTAETVIKQIKQQEQRFHDQDTAKAKIHTWLAWQKDPGKPMGQALSKNYFDTQASDALTFIQWIRDLFEIAC